MFRRLFDAMFRKFNYVHSAAAAAREHELNRYARDLERQMLLRERADDEVVFLRRLAHDLATEPPAIREAIRRLDLAASIAGTMIDDCRTRRGRPMAV